MLVADVYQQWMVGATAVAAQDVTVLFETQGNPGDPQVQAILRTLSNPGSKDDCPTCVDTRLIGARGSAALNGGTTK